MSLNTVLIETSHWPRPLLIFLNKHLLTTVGFRYPACLSGLGVACSWVCSTALVHSGTVRLEHSSKISR